MRTIIGNIWDLYGVAKVIPTNGIVKHDGNAVMGAGLARQAAERVPALKRILGASLQRFGNRVYVHELTPAEHDITKCRYIITFPTKSHYNLPSKLHIIEESTRQLVDFYQTFHMSPILVPLVGTGLGGLSPELIEAFLAECLDDNFILVKQS